MHCNSYGLPSQADVEAVLVLPYTSLMIEEQMNQNPTSLVYSRRNIISSSGS